MNHTVTHSCLSRNKVCTLNALLMCPLPPFIESCILNDSMAKHPNFKLSNLKIWVCIGFRIFFPPTHTHSISLFSKHNNHHHSRTITSKCSHPRPYPLVYNQHLYSFRVLKKGIKIFSIKNSGGSQLANSHFFNNREVLAFGSLNFKIILLPIPESFFIKFSFKRWENYFSHKFQARH